MTNDDPQKEQPEQTLSITPRFLNSKVKELVPGLFLTTIIAGISVHVGKHVNYITPLIAAMFAGMLLRNAFVVPGRYKPGIIYSMKGILRWGIVLLGAKVTFDQILNLGGSSLVITLVPLVLTMLLTILFGKIIKADPVRTILIAAGTSICGASAILAVSSVVKSKEDNVIVSIGAITVFGTLAMLLYPYINSSLLFLDETLYGIWAGASIHEVAQVVVASYHLGDVALEKAIIVKLARVIMIVPICLIFSFLVQKGYVKADQDVSNEEDQSIVPLFIIGFIIMLTLNSLGFFTANAVEWLYVGALFCLTTAIAGMGLETDFELIKKIGYKPMLLITFSTLCISLSSLVLIKYFHQ